MRRFVKLLFLMLLMSVEAVVSQSVSLQDGTIGPAPLATIKNSGEGIASFTIQESSGNDVQTPVFGGLPNVTITVDLGDYIAPKNSGDVSLVSGTSNQVDVLSLFDVEYDSQSNILIFNQKAIIPADMREEISFPVVVTQNSSRDESFNGFSANIVARGSMTDASGSTSFFTYTSSPALEVIKSVTNFPPHFSVGTTINYEIVVTNSGDEVINNIDVTDASATIVSGTPITSLEPGISTTVVASYTLTQADIDNGSYSNTAVATGDSPYGTDDVVVVSDAGTDANGNTINNPLTIDGPDEGSDPTDDPTVIDLTDGQQASMAMIKSVTSTGPYDVGTDITYEIVVTNTGTLMLNDIEVSDIGATILSGSPITSLEPGASATVQASYTLTASDFDNGSYSNSALATGNSPTGIDDVVVVSDAGTDENGNTIENPLTVDGPDFGPDPTDDPTVLSLIGAMTMIKSVTSNAPYSVGDMINYEIVVTNTGTTNITNIEVVDNDATLISDSTIPSLAPGVSTTLLASHTLTQADLDAGTYSNSASATGDSVAGTDNVSVVSDTGTDQYGNTITNPLMVDGPDPGNDPTDDPTVTDLTGGQNEHMTLIKSVTSSGPYGVGDTVTYEMVLTNTGTLMLSNIDVTDAGATILSGSPIATLNPGETATVQASYTITQADIDHGSYTNIAVATGDSPSGINDVVSVSDAGTDENGNTITNPLLVDGPDEGNNPTDDPTILNLVGSMSLVKSVVSTGPYLVGDVITYELEVINTGETTITNIEITDLGATIVSGNPVAVLGPGASATVIATYTLTESDIINESYTNIATATGDSVGGTDNVTTVSDAGTDENGNVIPSPLEYDGPDAGDNPRDDPTILNLDPCLQVFNEFSPNGDGVNEYFKINCIEAYKDNMVEIFNRWGNAVYQASGYDNHDIAFRGVSEGRGNLKAKEQLPTGTYFYVIDLGNGSELIKGWLYLNR